MNPLVSLSHLLTQHEEGEGSRERLETQWLDSSAHVSGRWTEALTGVGDLLAQPLVQQTHLLKHQQAMKGKRHTVTEGA